MNIDLSGRVALVTGGSRGIGKEIGRRLGGAGAKVALADVVDEVQIQASADEIGRGAIAVSANVTDPEHCSAAVSRVEEALGPIDVLDHSSRAFTYGSKMGIDATRKWPEEGFTREWPDKIVMDNETRRKIDEIWSRLGIDLTRDE